MGPESSCTFSPDPLDIITMTVYGNRRMTVPINTVAREILLGFWKVHILHHAAEGPVYGQWMMGELRRHGYDISPGTLYPLLQRMERHGWLRREPMRGNGPRARMNYRITRMGRAVLALVRKQVEEMQREVVQETKGMSRARP
jgi:PadR family transcriptional regulator PadR